MSLINDALRTARYLTDTGNGTNETGPAYRVGGTPLLSPFRTNGMIIITIAAVVGVAAGGAFMMSRVHALVPKVEQALSSGRPETPAASARHTSLVVSAETMKNLQTVPTVTPPPPPLPEPPKLTLQGITQHGAIREAMINGYTLREGDEIEGARVEAIDSNRVLLRHAGRQLTLRLH